MQYNSKGIPSEGEDERTLLDYWRVLVKHRRLIAVIVIVSVFATVIYSLLQTNIYQSKAVIAPVSDSGGRSRRLAALASRLTGMPRINLPGTASSSEIVALLNSTILRRKIIEKYNLLPVIFYEQWDEEKNDWKKEDSFNPFRLVGDLVGYVSRLLRPDESAPAGEEEEGVPSVWDGLRALDNMVRINDNIDRNTIEVSVEFHDPKEAAAIAGYFLTTLNSHMSEEAKRVAETNRKYLEEQLERTADPFIKQKIYSLIARQIETSMMAEVKENFAFKVLDPPTVPDRKIKPKRSLMVIISFILSVFAGVFIAFFLENIERARQKERSLSIRMEDVDA
ncbi:MAG TPA: hypothetical protein ENJ04_02915 [Nitrospirae bacterium]|nr:hypothetical protein [Nitrospirota bacterium]